MCVFLPNNIPCSKLISYKFCINVEWKKKAFKTTKLLLGLNVLIHTSCDVLQWKGSAGFDPFSRLRFLLYITFIIASNSSSFISLYCLHFFLIHRQWHPLVNIYKCRYEISFTLLYNSLDLLAIFIKDLSSNDFIIRHHPDINHLKYTQYQVYTMLMTSEDQKNIQYETLFLSL